WGRQSRPERGPAPRTGQTWPGHRAPRPPPCIPGRCAAGGAAGNSPLPARRNPSARPVPKKRVSSPLTEVLRDLGGLRAALRNSFCDFPEENPEKIFLFFK